ncbi:hypothetical protein [Trueperella pyogenes]|uniref:hypothetical protein n=1 Tax=Trueperella pyogenes TaxID=1661 RepID=UPI00324976D3
MSKLSKEHRRILAAFRTHGPLTDSELEAIAEKEQWPKAGEQNYYRRRRSDLKTRGIVAATDTKRLNPRGGSETVWTLTSRKVLNEGKTIFRRINENQWAIQGTNLTPGKTAAVTTKAGDEKRVIVGHIIKQQNGTQIAEFSWPIKTMP